MTAFFVTVALLSGTLVLAHSLTRPPDPLRPKDTADGWVKRIDRDALAEVLDDCFPGCDGPAAEDFIERYAVIAADAVLAALPDLMGGEGR